MVTEPLGFPKDGASLICTLARFSANGSFVMSDSSPRTKYFPSLLT